MQECGQPPKEIIDELSSEGSSLPKLPEMDDCLIQ
jgi:hypothetical protein